MIVDVVSSVFFWVFQFSTDKYVHIYKRTYKIGVYNNIIRMSFGQILVVEVER